MTANEYERLIRQYDYKKLTKLWENVKKRKDIKDWSIGKAFEYL